MNQVVVTQLSLFRFGVRRWTRKVNALLNSGYSFAEPTTVMRVGFFRIFLYAVLVKGM